MRILRAVLVLPAAARYALSFHVPQVVSTQNLQGLEHRSLLSSAQLPLACQRASLSLKWKRPCHAVIVLTQTNATSCSSHRRHILQPPASCLLVVVLLQHHRKARSCFAPSWKALFTQELVISVSVSLQKERNKTGGRGAVAVLLVVVVVPVA